MRKGIKNQLDGLFYDTIQPALVEDFIFKSDIEIQEAVDYLTDKIKSLLKDKTILNCNDYSEGIQ